jgi:hypothetical protein
MENDALAALLAAMSPNETGKLLGGVTTGVQAAPPVCLSVKPVICVA